MTAEAKGLSAGLLQLLILVTWLLASLLTAVLRRPCGLGLASVEGEHFSAASRGSGAGDKLPADLPTAKSGKGLGFKECL